MESGLEHKFCRLDAQMRVVDGTKIEGYASVFGACDQGGDVVEPGAYSSSLRRLAAQKRGVKMLWQHDPAQPIGVWDEVQEDGTGLFVKGRLLKGVARAREAAELIGAGAIDGLSIGYRTVRAGKADQGGRLLKELDLWEVSLVTFPMLPVARVAQKAEDQGWQALGDLTRALVAARQELSGK